MAFWAVDIKFPWSSSGALPWTCLRGESQLSKTPVAFNTLFVTNHYWKVNSNPGLCHQLQRLPLNKSFQEMNFLIQKSFIGKGATTTSEVSKIQENIVHMNQGKLGIFLKCGSGKFWLKLNSCRKLSNCIFLSCNSYFTKILKSGTMKSKLSWITEYDCKWLTFMIL